MRYSISHWSGRLGNNIQQVANALMLAEHKKHSFQQKLDHDLIEKFITIFGIDGSITNGTFYSWEPLVHCDNGGFVGGNEIGLEKEYIYANMRRVCRDYVYPQLKVSKLEPFDDDTLVIHIRGGDIIEKEFDRAHNYVQNPLSFYLEVLENFKRGVVILEPNSNNPIISELKKNDKLKFQSLSVAEDYATLLAAKNLATSGVGTFSISAALCSRNIKNLFTSDAYLTEHLNCTMLHNTDVKVHEIKLENYIPVYPCSWKNNEEQRKLMIEYKLPKFKLERI